MKICRSFGTQKVLYNNINGVKQVVIDCSTDFKETILSQKAKKYLKCLSDHIEDVWAKIKRGETFVQSPRFICSKSGEVAVFAPLYGSNRPTILMELDDGKYCQRFFFDRGNPEIFRYEKTVDTDFGYATLKTYNSLTNKDEKIEHLAESKLLEYIPEILPGRYSKEIQEFMESIMKK